MNLGIPLEEAKPDFFLRVTPSAERREKSSGSSPGAPAVPVGQHLLPFRCLGVEPELAASDLQTPLKTFGGPHRWTRLAPRESATDVTSGNVCVCVLRVRVCVYGCGMDTLRYRGLHVCLFTLLCVVRVYLRQNQGKE